MRCSLGPRKITRYRQQTGLDIVHGWVRGGTDHRVDLGLADGSIVELYKDGSIKRSPIGWNKKGDKTPA